MSLEAKKPFAPAISKLTSQENKPTLHRLAEAFHTEVVATGRFPWLGLVSATDRLQRPRLAVYLTEREAGTYDPTQADQDITPDLVSLSLACQQGNTFLDLYYLRSTASDQTVAERALNDAQNRYQDKEAELLYEEKISDTQVRDTRALVYFQNQIKATGVADKVARIELYDHNKDGENPVFVRLKADFHPKQGEGIDTLEKIHVAEWDVWRRFHPLPFRFSVIFEDVQPMAQAVERFYGTAEMPEPLITIEGGK